MNPQATQQTKTRIIALSFLSAIGITILSLLVGTILDYIIVQILSQYFLSNCSEDCYFAYFNMIFLVVVLLSSMIGFAGGTRTYRRLSERL
jgi:multisubunit Na+/H+ antiporter MnhB subunit